MSVKQSRHWYMWMFTVYLRSDMFYVEESVLMVLGLRVTASTVSLVLSLVTLSLCCHSLTPPCLCIIVTRMSQHRSRGQIKHRVTRWVAHRSQSIDLSRGILKTSEFGELINTRAFSSSRIPEKMRTDRHFAACSPKKLNLLQTLKLSCHSYFKCVMWQISLTPLFIINSHFASSKFFRIFVVFEMQINHFFNSWFF